MKHLMSQMGRIIILGLWIQSKQKFWAQLHSLHVSMLIPNITHFMLSLPYLLLLLLLRRGSQTHTHTSFEVPSNTLKKTNSPFFIKFSRIIRASRRFSSKNHSKIHTIGKISQNLSNLLSFKYLFTSLTPCFRDYTS